MDEVIEWINNNFKGNFEVEGIEIVGTSMHYRQEPLEYEWRPSNKAEFEHVINHAPPNVLFGMGFRKWDTMNNIIQENMTKPVDKKINVPIINAEAIPDEERPNYPNGNLVVDVGKKFDVPTELLDPDEDIWLIPGEWFDILPNGYEFTDIFGQTEVFDHARTDDDIRFGCLSFGIRRPVDD